MEVSIIIPVFNCLDLTRACLESLERTVPRRLTYEVFLVDDGSTDGSREWFRTLPASRYRVLLNDPPHQGYARNNNRAARLANGEVLCLLNNDTVLMPGWLTEMLRVLRAGNGTVGLVGNIQREPASGLIDHRGVVFNRRGNPIHVGKDSAVPPDTVSERWPAVTAACCVIRRDTFLGLGGFDEGYQNGFEDVDLCLRAGERGLRHFVAHRSVIYHHISASPGRHARQRDNLRLWRRRWGWRVLAWRHRERFLRRRAERHLAPRPSSPTPTVAPPVRSSPVVAPPSPSPSSPPNGNGSGGADLTQKQTEWLARYRHAWSAEWTRRARERWQRAWDARREERRQLRQDVLDAREDGRRYLRKHCFRPWRYSLRRVFRALEQTLRPLPAPIPALPRYGALRFTTPVLTGFDTAHDVNHEETRDRPGVPGGFLVFDPADF